MFRCLWLHTPPEQPLATRLYTRTFGRTYGRRRADTDQPISLPQDLRLSEAPAPIATGGDSPVAANQVHRAA
jgi:hypothetical protein